MVPNYNELYGDLRGQILRGLEYYDPDDEYSVANLRYLEIEKVETYSIAGEEVHNRIAANGRSKAAILRILDSEWKNSFQQNHLQDCEHFQIMFYDEILDVICRKIVPGRTPLTKNQEAHIGS